MSLFFNMFDIKQCLIWNIKKKFDIKHVWYKPQQLFDIKHEMKNGWIYLNENPGLGLNISEKSLKKFGKLMYKNK